MIFFPIWGEGPTQPVDTTKNKILWAEAYTHSYLACHPPCLKSSNLRTQRVFDQECFDSNYIHYSILSSNSPAFPAFSF